MKRAALISLGIVAVLFVGKFILMALFGGGGFEPPTDAVNVTKAFKRDWVTQINSVGTVTPEFGVTLRAEEAGVVEEILFESGDLIKAGDILFKLDRQVELAELEGAKAEAKAASYEFNRAKTLKSTKSISDSEFDLIQSRYKANEAKVNSLLAKIERKEIKALFAGKAGKRLVNKGDYITAGEPLVELHSEELFYVDFSVPQRFLQLLKVGLPILVSSDYWRSEGIVQSVNPNIDPVTRQISVRGVLKAGGRSGLYVSVSVLTDEKESLVAIPLSSVNFAPFGDTVFVLENEENGIYTSKQRTVRLGKKEGDQVAVISGINEGELVVSGGAFKLVPDGKVVVIDEAAPSSEREPQVKNS